MRQLALGLPAIRIRQRAPSSKRWPLPRKKPGNLDIQLEGIVNLIVLLVILLLLFGGGGFYAGGPAIGGSLGGVILLIIIVLLLTGRLR